MIMLELFGYLLALLVAALLLTWLARGLIRLFAWDPWEAWSYHRMRKSFRNVQPKP
jgi:hypothetical protein